MHPTGIHRLFELQASLSPDAVALVQGSLRWTYGELDRRANHLAKRLAGSSIRRGQLVGLLAPRSMEMVAGILGILKAGAAYVPLSPELPEERLRFMVGDAQPPVIVAHPHHLEMANRLGAAVKLQGMTDAFEATGPEIKTDPSDLAYVIYTSGSTGQPKGVSLPHAGLLALIPHACQQMTIGPEDRILQFASFGFDASIWEIFVALASGATLVIGTRDQVMPGPSLAELLREQQVTVALLSPSVLQILPAEGLPKLRVIVAGTEKLTGSIIAKWKTGGRRFFNAYGPTETTIYQTIWEAGDPPYPDNPPIGKATPGVDLYIIGEDLQMMERGQSGELLIGGSCLGREYLHREALTREKFIELPINGSLHRVYRSGDRARQLEDGNFEYLGRMDFQVKIRGFRVELGEIEFILSQHPGVGSCVVIADLDAMQQTRLWAYFIATGALTPTPQILREFISERLPDYMVPAGFTLVRRWPLNANGKLDREALPKPEVFIAHTTEPGETPEERTLLQFCSEILAFPGLGPSDDLLQAGFHSLALAQLAWRIQGAFGVSIPYTQMFALPTVRAFAKAIQSRSGTAASSQPLSLTEGNPLSFAQERVCFLEQLHPGNNAYRFQSLFKFKGPFDPVAMERALNQMVKRHEVLRTVFLSISGTVEQRVQSYEPFPVVCIPCTVGEAEHHIQEVLSIPFEVEKGPLAKWFFYQVAPAETWMLHTEHHLLHDGWGYGIFLEEMLALYDANVRGEDLHLPPAPQFLEFCRWERSQLKLWEEDISYWVEKLDSVTTPPQLPCDFPRSQSDPYAGAQLRIPLDDHFCHQLQGRSSEFRVTPFMWLLGVFQAFMQRLTGENDVVIGAGFQNRPGANFQRMLGMAINTVALRVDVTATETFADLLALAKTASLEASDHQHAPYDRVIHRLGSDRKLFTVFFDLYDQPFPTSSLSDLKVTATHGLGAGTCKFDIVLLVIPGQDTPLEMLWEYNTTVFSPESGQRMSRQFLSLAQASLNSPQAAWRNLSLAEPPPTEWLQGGSLPNNPPPTVPALFQRIANIHPEEPALWQDGRTMTYAELDQCSNGAARWIRDQGVQSGEFVGLAMQRGMETIVAMLGILKAGAAYLPMDPDWPAARQDLLTKTAAVKLIIAGPIPEHEGPTPPVTINAESPAYVLFTSGSTGIPKGVVIPHRAILRLVLGLPEGLLGPGERILHFAALSFDASTFEIWGALLHGGCVVIHRDVLPDYKLLGDTIREGKVSTCWLTAAHFNQVVDTAPEILTGVVKILTGGEALSVPHIIKAQNLFPDATIVNGYGPTECTTFATCYEIPRPLPENWASIPIGRPLKATQALVLDERRQMCSIGQPGELHLGGEGLGLGYLNDPELTADKFRMHTHNFHRPQRLYRTGDMVRWRSDGLLEFLGRTDTQLKIRGFRIEPGEIESVLLQHPQIRQAVVGLVKECLVAWIAPHVILDSVQKWLQEKLPAYMLPAHIVAMDQFPLNQNGKLDRSALPSPNPESPTTSDPPRGEREILVAAIWMELLGLKWIGRHDTFFQAGGHSLLLTRGVARLRAETGTDLSLAQVMKLSSVAAVAHVLSQASDSLPIRRLPRQAV